MKIFALLDYCLYLCWENKQKMKNSFYNQVFDVLQKELNIDESRRQSFVDFYKKTRDIYHGLHLIWDEKSIVTYLPLLNVVLSGTNVSRDLETNKKLIDVEKQVLSSLTDEDYKNISDIIFQQKLMAHEKFNGLHKMRGFDCERFYITKDGEEIALTHQQLIEIINVINK